MNAAIFGNGNLPKRVSRELNAVWATAGEQIPSSEALQLIGRQLGHANIPRFRNVFVDKAHRARRGSGRSTAADDVV